MVGYRGPRGVGGPNKGCEKMSRQVLFCPWCNSKTDFISDCGRCRACLERDADLLFSIRALVLEGLKPHTCSQEFCGFPHTELSPNPHHANCMELDSDKFIEATLLTLSLIHI